MYGLEIPLNFSFRPKVGRNVKLITDFGTYTRYDLFGNTEYVLEDLAANDGSTYTVNKSTYDAYNCFDMGLNLGIGIEYKAYSLIGSCQIGFTEAEDDIMSKHQVFRIGLGYRF
jgi:hypothetical protein